MGGGWGTVFTVSLPIWGGEVPQARGLLWGFSCLSGTPQTERGARIEGKVGYTHKKKKKNTHMTRLTPDPNIAHLFSLSCPLL